MCKRYFFGKYVFSVLKIEKSGMYKTEYVYKGQGKNLFIYFLVSRLDFWGYSHLKY